MKMSDNSTQLWDYALSLYSAPGVADACLVLQDEGGADVCELLWVCWLAHQNLRPADDIGPHLRNVRRWQATYTYPLRAQRRALKPEAANSKTIARLRQTIKEAELLAEREALQQLQRLSQQGRETVRMAPGDTLVNALRRLTPRLSRNASSALAQLARAAGAEPPASC